MRVLLVTCYNAAIYLFKMKIVHKVHKVNDIKEWIKYNTKNKDEYIISQQKDGKSVSEMPCFVSNWMKNLT